MAKSKNAGKSAVSQVQDQSERKKALEKANAGKIADMAKMHPLLEKKRTHLRELREKERGKWDNPDDQIIEVSEASMPVRRRDDYDDLTDEELEALMAENEIEVLDKYLRNLRPFTEVAINGNDLSHPEILAFLVYLRKKKIITNITVSQKHFVRNYHRLMGWTERGLIHGLGVSLLDSEDSEFLEKIKHFPNAVIHVIAGLFNGDDLDNLAGKGLKLLILGYKNQ